MQDGLPKCVYCHREECSDCPLPFDDKVTLYEYLDKAKVSTQSYFYYEDPKCINGAMRDSKKKFMTPQKKTNPNLEFELEIAFNGNKCWASYENLQRFQAYEQYMPHKSDELSQN